MLPFFEKIQEIKKNWFIVGVFGTTTIKKNYITGSINIA